MSIRKSIIVLALTLPALSAFALDSSGIVKSTPLKGGATLHEFNDGKMAMEDKYGRASHLNHSTVMETADGKSITMVGDEVARLNQALQKHGKR
nr:CopK family periplasmic copper-binding protein [uncultured Albidiferax sp.]